MFAVLTAILFEYGVQFVRRIILQVALLMLFLIDDLMRLRAGVNVKNALSVSPLFFGLNAKFECKLVIESVFTQCLLAQNKKKRRS